MAWNMDSSPQITTLASASSEPEDNETEPEVNLYLISWITVYCLPTLLTSGIIGTLVLIAIAVRMVRCGAVSTVLYVVIASLMDQPFLCLIAVDEWMQQFAHVDVRQMAVRSSASLCKLYPFVSDFVLHMSVWSMVAMSVETTLVRLNPKKWAAQLLRLDHARDVLLLLVVLLVCVNAHCFWTYTLVPLQMHGTSLRKPEGNHQFTDVCTYVRQGNQQNDIFFKFVWPILLIVLIDLLPVAIIVFCILMQLCARWRRVKRKDAILSSSVEKCEKINGNNGAESVLGELELSFICLCFYHVILLSPMSVYNLIDYIKNFDSPESSDGTEYFPPNLETSSAAAVSSRFLLYIFCSCKWLVMLVTSKECRRHLVHLCTCCCCRSIHHRFWTPCVSPAKPRLSRYIAYIVHHPPIGFLYIIRLVTGPNLMHCLRAWVNWEDLYSVRVHRVLGTIIVSVVTYYVCRPGGTPFSLTIPFKFVREHNSLLSSDFFPTISSL